MPLIPILPPSTAPLAEAPATIFDRERRPTVDTRGVQQAMLRYNEASKMPLMDPAVGAAPYEALGSVGKAIQQTGSIIGAAALKERESIIIRQQGEFDVRLTNEMADMEQMQREHGQEPETWQPMAQQKFAKLRESVAADKKLLPQAREAILHDLNVNEAAYMRNLGTAVQMANHSLARNAILGTMEKMASKGNYAGVSALAQSPQARERIFPHELQQVTEKTRLQAIKLEDQQAVGLVHTHGTQGVSQAVSIIQKSQIRGEAEKAATIQNLTYLGEVQRLTSLAQEEPYAVQRQLEGEEGPESASLLALETQDRRNIKALADRQVQARGILEARDAAKTVDRAHVAPGQTKSVAKMTAQDLGAGELKHASPLLRSAVDHRAAVRLGRAPMDRPALVQLARSWIIGYDPAQDPDGVKAQEVRAWMDLSFDPRTASSLQGELAGQLKDPHPQVPLRRAFQRLDALAIGLPPTAAGDSTGGDRDPLMTYYRLSENRAREADDVKNLLLRRRAAGGLKDESQALELVEAAYPPEKRSPVHGGTAPFPDDVNVHLARIPEQVSGINGGTDTVYNPFRFDIPMPAAGSLHLQRQHHSPLSIARQAAAHTQSPIEVAEAVRAHQSSLEESTRQGDPVKYFAGMAKVDVDTRQVLDSLLIAAQQQVLQSRLTDPAQMQRALAVLEQQMRPAGQDGRRPQVPLEFIPLMRELQEVMEHPVFQPQAQGTYTGSVDVGGAPLARYQTRSATDGMLDVGVLLEDGSLHLVRLPDVTAQDVQAKAAELQKTIQDHLQNAKEAEERLRNMSPHSGRIMAPITEPPGAEDTRRADAAAQELELLQTQGRDYLVAQRVREELASPRWEGLVGKYGGLDEVKKGLFTGALHANALVTRVFGPNNGLNQLGGKISDWADIPRYPVTQEGISEALNSADWAMEGSSRRRLVGGLANEAILGTQQGFGYMLPSLAGGSLFTGTRLLQGVATAASRLGVAGGTSVAQAVGGSYANTQTLIEQALANKDTARAEHLAKYRDVHAALTGLLSLSIERFSTLHNLAPAAGRGLRTAAGQLVKESAEGVVNDVTQAEIIDRLIQDGSGYDWRNLPTSMATGLATSTVMKGAQQSLGVLRPNKKTGTENATPLSTDGSSVPRVFSTTHLEGEKAVSSTGATVLPVQGKMNLAAKGYPPAEVEQYIKEHYDPEKYRELGGDNTVWVVTPSTSGKNIIPAILAERLAKDHGGTVLSEGLEISQAQQAKLKRGYLAKMAEPTKIKIADPQLVGRLEGKRVVIVDDIMTSGETTEAITQALKAAGIHTDAIAVIAAVKGGELANKSQITELAKIIASATGKPLSKVLEEVKLAHQQSRGKFVVEALREAREKPNEVYESISRKASAVREAARSGR